ncbi:MAG: hypothetical protein NVSMB31_01080 [Vulcanimicrobiaceae bacterium]
MSILRVTSLAGVLFGVLGAPAFSAAADKQLENTKGSVTYQHGVSSDLSLATHATVVLADDDFATTGTASQAAVTLPDSSRVTMGESTKVQLAFFNRVDGANNAKIVVLNGKTRFKVEHPRGAKANYIFVTPVADIAVRGTDGDILVQNDTLQVSIYSIGDPANPVEVTFTKGDKAGTKVVLFAGQTLFSSIASGSITERVANTTSTDSATFTAEFGRDPNAFDFPTNSPPQNRYFITSDMIPIGTPIRVRILVLGSHDDRIPVERSPIPMFAVEEVRIDGRVMVPTQSLGFAHYLAGTAPCAAAVHIIAHHITLANYYQWVPVTFGNPTLSEKSNDLEVPTPACTARNQEFTLYVSGAPYVYDHTGPTF